LETVTETQTPNSGFPSPDAVPAAPERPAASKRSEDGSKGGRGFRALFVTQFQGALNDNVLKWLVVFMILGMNVSTAECIASANWSPPCFRCRSFCFPWRVAFSPTVSANGPSA